MSLGLRLRCNVPVRIQYNLIFRPVCASNSINFDGTSRYLNLPAENPEQEEELEMFEQKRLPTDYNPSKFDPSEFPSPPTPRVFRLVDEVVELTLAEARELGSIIMKKRGLEEITKTALVYRGAAETATDSAMEVKEEKVPEKTIFDLKLESFEAASKLKIVKEVRGFTNFGLKEAKELVEKAPVVLKSGVTKEEAEKMIETMTALGAKVIMQ